MSQSVQMIHINMSIKGAWAPFSDSMAELIQVMTQSRIRKTDVKPWKKKNRTTINRGLSMDKSLKQRTWGPSVVEKEQGRVRDTEV